MRGRSKEFIRTSFLSGVSTAIKIVLGFISNKITSIYLGPSGFALLGQFNNFSAIAGSFTSGGIGTGVAKYVAEYYDNIVRREKAIKNGLLITLISSVVVGLCIALLSHRLSVYLLLDEKYSSIFVIFGFFTVFSASNFFITSLLIGYKEVTKLTILNIILAVVAVLVLIPLVILWGLYGALLAGVVTLPISFIISLVALNTAGFDYTKMFPGFEKESFVKLLGYSAMTITTALTAPISQIMVRNEIVTSLSLESAGYWQGMIRISDTYLTILTMSLSVYYLPRLSELQRNEDLRREIFIGYRILLPLMVILTLSLYFSRDVVIHVFFTPNFSPMQALFPFQLLGDFFKIASWVLSYLMVAKAMTSKFILTEILFAVWFVTLSFVFLRSFGLVGVSYAHAVSYFLYLITMMLMFRKVILV